MENGEFARLGIAAQHQPVGGTRKPCDLQLQVILVRPEPRHFAIGLWFSNHGKRGVLGLVDGVLHAFQPDGVPLASHMPGAVARRPDMGIAGSGIPVHHNAVFGSQTCPDRQFVARNHADPHQHDIRRIAVAARDHPLHLAIAFEGFHAGLQFQFHPGLFMLGGIEGR